MGKCLWKSKKNPLVCKCALQAVSLRKALSVMPFTPQRLTQQLGVSFRASHLLDNDRYLLTELPQLLGMLPHIIGTAQNAGASTTQAPQHG